MSMKSVASTVRRRARRTALIGLGVAATATVALVTFPASAAEGGTNLTFVTPAGAPTDGPRSDEPVENGSTVVPMTVTNLGPNSVPGDTFTVRVTLPDLPQNADIALLPVRFTVQNGQFVRQELYCDQFLAGNRCDFTVSPAPAAGTQAIMIVEVTGSWPANTRVRSRILDVQDETNISDNVRRGLLGRTV